MQSATQCFQEHHGMLFREANNIFRPHKWQVTNIGPFVWRRKDIFRKEFSEKDVLWLLQLWLCTLIGLNLVREIKYLCFSVWISYFLTPQRKPLKGQLNPNIQCTLIYIDDSLYRLNTCYLLLSLCLLMLMQHTGRLIETEWMRSLQRILP